MKLPNLFGKKDVSSELEKASPYTIRTVFVPYKLYANRKGSAALQITLANATTEPLMTSVVVALPKQLSFGQIGIDKEKEVRLGILGPKEEKEASIDIFSDAGTDKGEYTLQVSVFAHYMDYRHIINGIKKRVQLEVV